MYILVVFLGLFLDGVGDIVIEVLFNNCSDVVRVFCEEGIYSVFIVVNKFQIGFDEFRLMVMYVDKFFLSIVMV